MASAVTSGAVALLLQAQPELNPDQVKWRLMHTALRLPHSRARYLYVYKAVPDDSRETANTGQEVSQLLWTGPEPPIWNSVHWNSVHWDNVYWGDPVYSSSISWD